LPARCRLSSHEANKRRPIVIRYRPFRNNDPPALAEIWRGQAPLRGLYQPMSPSVLEQFVFSKVYFDHHDLLVAEDDHRVVGFAHAGFGPNDARTGLCTNVGVICMVMTAPIDGRHDIAAGLVKRVEERLTEAGATVVYGGGTRRLDPFYLGLYGGSELPGVLASDKATLDVYRSLGYQEIDRCVILQRELAAFRPLVDRRQMMVRRSHNVEAIYDPPAANWWEACTIGQTDQTLFELMPRAGGPSSGHAHFWELQPISHSWGVRASGLYHIEVPETLWRQGLATHLVGEALRQLHEQGISLVEVQLMQHQAAALDLFRKLEFREVEQGVVFRKEM
jgi:GNAT superfamily N-acetyltransferase